jgi:hypothetical protein
MTKFRTSFGQITDDWPIPVSVALLPLDGRPGSAVVRALRPVRITMPGGGPTRTHRARVVAGPRPRILSEQVLRSIRISSVLAGIVPDMLLLAQAQVMLRPGGRWVSCGCGGI